MYGPAAQIGVLLPYSRKQESEADHYGLTSQPWPDIIRRRRSPSGTGWHRCEEQKPPELLSDHPADEQRIEDLKKVMPEAMKYYEGSKH